MKSKTNWRSLSLSLQPLRIARLFRTLGLRSPPAYIITVSLVSLKFEVASFSFVNALNILAKKIAFQHAVPVALRCLSSIDIFFPFAIQHVQEHGPETITIQLANVMMEKIHILPILSLSLSHSLSDAYLRAYIIVQLPPLQFSFP